MFEDMTYENILDDMLSRVDNDVDKREGSIIYDALAPAAYKLAETYFLLNNFIDLVSGDTAVGEYLDRVVNDYGIIRKKATYAIRKIETTIDVAIGTRWGIRDTSYTIIEKISTNKYKAKCEQLGDIGNIYSGILENIDNVSGVTATLTDILESGAEEENDDNLRSRFYQQLQAPATSGNSDNYRTWALQVEGVGDVKVFPLADGPGTVKILVVDSNMEIDETLEEKVYNYIETVRPIGAQVIVDSPTSKIINISANVNIDGTRLLENIKQSFSNEISKYLKDITFETYTVSYAKIGSILLGIDGVLDYSDLKINNNTTNVTISQTEMAIAGSIDLTEVT